MIIEAISRARKCIYTGARSGSRWIAGLAGIAVAILSFPVVSQEIVIEDAFGREVQLDGPASSIAVIPMPMASTVISVDQGVGSLVGMNPSSKAAIFEGILGRIFPEARDISSNISDENFIPNAEELARLNPDLVIQWGTRGEDIVAPIVNAGLAVMLLDSGPEEAFRQNFRLISEALGVPERAVEHTAWREAVYQQIENEVTAIPQDARPRVVHIANALANFAVAGSTGGQNTNIVLTGGVNVGAESGTGTSQPVNKEQVAAWNPEVIFLNSFEDALSPDFVYNDPILSLTDAARNGRVYKYPLGGYRWDPPNQESPLAWMWMANILHPDVFQFDLRAEMRSAYIELYDYELGEPDIDEILRLDMQGSTPNYQQFAGG